MSIGGGSECVTHVWRRKRQLLRPGYPGSCCYPGVIADEVRMSNVADFNVLTLSLSLSLPTYGASNYPQGQCRFGPFEEGDGLEGD